MFAFTELEQAAQPLLLTVWIVLSAAVLTVSPDGLSINNSDNSCMYVAHHETVGIPQGENLLSVTCPQLQDPM